VSALEALKTARAAGIELRLEGDDLILEASSPPPPAILDLLSHHKADLVAMLSPGGDGWSAEDWQSFFDERAGSAEFDNGASREQAEVSAYLCCIAEWLNRHPSYSRPDVCLWCGAPDSQHDPLLPHGVETTGHSWLHSRCWTDWYAQRRKQASLALAAMGIDEPRAKADRKPADEHQPGAVLHESYSGRDRSCFARRRSAASCRPKGCGRSGDS
jgi:hypothetical protein